MERFPLISCLCLSYQRPELLQNVINSFLSQTYPNKQLVVISHKDDTKTASVVKSFNNKLIKYFNAPKRSIGELRNFAISKAEGDYFCQWDDDDWYHKDRLKIQMAEIQKTGKLASVLAYWIMFNKVTNEAYMSAPLMWAGTLLCSKKIFHNGIKYPKLSKNEDTEFMFKLYRANCLCPIVNPSLYIYVFHGSNTWDANHFQTLFSSSQKLSVETCNELKKIISHQYSINAASKILTNPSFVGKLDFFQSWL